MNGFTPDQVDDIFSFHPPKTPEVGELHDQARALMRDAAQWVLAHAPDSPEQTLAIRKLQEAMMYINAAIAIHS